jgi:anti-sigma regulatory factor (Ser/Thr protein kinase)
MRRINREFNVRIDAIELIRHWMLGAFQIRGQPGPEIRSDVLVAVTEVFVNFVKHSNLKVEDVIEIQLEFTEEALVIIFKESGEPFDITELEDPDLDALHESGYGLFIVKSLMDTFEYFPKNSGKAHNITKMTKGYDHGERPNIGG